MKTSITRAAAGFPGHVRTLAIYLLATLGNEFGGIVLGWLFDIV